MSFGCVMLTGASGRLAARIRPLVAPDCSELRLVDRLPVTLAHPNETAAVLDLAELAAGDPVMTGVDAILHFAGFPREAEWPTLVEANVVACIALWEAARVHGIGRIVYATSNHAVGYYARDRRIDGSVRARPDSRYGVTKAFMESLASMYADKFGVRAFGVRIGHCAPEPSNRRMLSHWIHPEDLASLIRVGLAADYDNEIVYGVSANPRSWYDNARAHALGYAPVHSAERFAEALAGRHGVNPVEERYQGGEFAALEYAGDPARPSRAR